MFDDEGRWMLPDDTDPRAGYWQEEVDAATTSFSIPSNDVYGQLYLFHHHQLHHFLLACERRAINFLLTAVDVEDLQQTLQQVQPSPVFDRIDVSNIIDEAWRGVGPILKVLEPLLSPIKPYATISGHFINAIRLMEEEQDRSMLNHPYHKLCEYFPPIVDTMNHQDDPYEIMRGGMIAFFFPYEEWFQVYRRGRNVGEVAAAQGLVEMSRNTVVAEWPWVFRSIGDVEKDRQLSRGLMVHGSQATTRYIEWVRKVCWMIKEPDPH